MTVHPFELGLLRCTVRGCMQALLPRERALVCSNAHAFDVARAGHVNLLQPQDRRSAEPGDTASAHAARARWFERGHASAVIDELRRRIASADLAAELAWLDLGCGSGAWTRALSPARAAFGLDLSAGAIESAARLDAASKSSSTRSSTGADARANGGANPNTSTNTSASANTRASTRTRRGWVVANADRGLPFGDATLGLVLSVHARLPEPELARVVQRGGRVLIVLQGARDFIELRERVLGAATELAQVERARAAFGAGWKALGERAIEARRVLDRAALADWLAQSYRGQRASEQARFAELPELAVTLAWHVLEYERC